MILINNTLSIEHCRVWFAGTMEKRLNGREADIISLYSNDPSAVHIKVMGNYTIYGTTGPQCGKMTLL